MARQFYKTESSSLCDICEGEDCGDACKIQANEQKASLDDMKDMAKSSTDQVIASSLVVIVGMFLIKMFN